MFGNFLGQRGRTPAHVNRVHNEVTWEDSELQWARLVTELARQATPRTMKRVATNMGLSQDQLAELIHRAEGQWADVVGRTDRQAYYPSVEVKKYVLEEMALYQVETPPTMEQLANPSPHLVTVEFNPLEGGVMLQIEPETIQFRSHPRINVGVSIQHGRAELFVSSITGDACVIRCGEDGDLDILVAQEEDTSTQEPPSTPSKEATSL